jgi:3-hydroxyisobutyrate dehydrogenase-like beta-hydroxyacid dehydrogenase
MARDGLDNHPPGPIGVIGLGLVGTALTRRLHAAGWTVLGFDHSVKARDVWSGEGELAESLMDLGRRCACVVLAVFDTAGVQEVVEGAADPGSPSGLLAGGRTQVVIDCSTGDPDALQALAARLEHKGVDFIEAPLSGSSQQIAQGQATMLLGGAQAALDRHVSMLQSLSPQRVHVGGAGMGARAKLATNLVLGLNRAAFAEGLVFAELLGIAPATFLELVLASPARSDAAALKGPLMVSGDFAPQSRIRQHLKDLELMLAAAASSGQGLPLTRAHAALLRDAVAAGDGELDNAAIVRQLRRESDKS